jgi:hypothetical protein
MLVAERYDGHMKSKAKKMKKLLLWLGLGQVKVT